MTPEDAALVARCREWAASPGGLAILGTLADRIEILSLGVGRLDRLRAALRSIDGMTVLPDPHGGYALSIHCPGGYDAAAELYQQLLQMSDL